MAKDSHLRNYLEVHSMSSDQVFVSIELKTFSKFNGWTFNFFLLLNCIIIYFIYLGALKNLLYNRAGAECNGANTFFSVKDSRVLRFFSK